MTIRSPNDVNYSTPRINSNSLREGGVELVLETLVDVNSNYAPVVRSSGDIVNYLEGEFIATGAINVGKVLATLPNTHLPRHSAFYAVTVRTNATDSVPTTVFVDTSDNTIKSGAVHVLGDIISLDGITYLGN